MDTRAPDGAHVSQTKRRRSSSETRSHGDSNAAGWWATGFENGKCPVPYHDARDRHDTGQDVDEQYACVSDMSELINGCVEQNKDEQDDEEDQDNWTQPPVAEAIEDGCSQPNHGSRKVPETTGSLVRYSPRWSCVAVHARFGAADDPGGEDRLP